MCFTIAYFLYMCHIIITQVDRIVYNIFGDFFDNGAKWEIYTFTSCVRKS
jgi:hypothetical protein